MGGMGSTRCMSSDGGAPWTVPPHTYVVGERNFPVKTKPWWNDREAGRKTEGIRQEPRPRML